MIATNTPKGTKVRFGDGLEVTETTDKPKQDTAGNWFVETLNGDCLKLDCLSLAGKHERVAHHAQAEFA